MRYQLVLQFPGNTLTNHDAMIALEDHLIDTLGSSANVDGHDSGSDECNIFVHTDQPAVTFQQARPSLVQAGLLLSLRAAYRRLDAEDYTVLWPEDFTGEFSVT